MTTLSIGDVVKIGPCLRKVRLVKCVDCATEFGTVWARQITCTECGIKRRAGASMRGVEARAIVKSGVISEIARTAGKQETRLTDLIGEEPDFWSVLYSVPFSLNVSKNRRWTNNGRGGKFLSQGVRDYQDLVIEATRQALDGIAVKQNKLWLSFYVEKPNNRIDAVNVVDTLCDAIKVAAGLDDKWFCIGKIDWCIKKIAPAIIIKITQKSDRDVIACSHCGDIQGIENFHKRAALPLGRARVCRSCTSKLNAAAKGARKRSA